MGKKSYGFNNKSVTHLKQLDLRVCELKFNPSIYIEMQM